MCYQLRKELSFCEVDGHLVFLDIAQDRYFRLTGGLEDALRRFLAHEDVAPTFLENLAAARILVETPDLEVHSTIADIQRPSRSAIEQASVKGDLPLGMAPVCEVMAIVWSTRRQLKRCTLKANLDKASAYRDRKAEPPEAAAPTTLEGDLLGANRQFARARRYVPIEPVCLLDSLSLLRFLSRRGLSANIVFGVTSGPFAAHCWVQAGDIVLNETLSDANAYTPIWRV